MEEEKYTQRLHNSSIKLDRALWMNGYSGSKQNAKWEKNEQQKKRDVLVGSDLQKRENKVVNFSSMDPPPAVSAGLREGRHR